MKVLIITPLNEQKIKEIENNTDSWLNDVQKHLISYRMNHPEFSVDLEFQYRTGTDKRVTNLLGYTSYFSEQEIDGLKEEIKTLIQEGEVIGLFINPVLTHQEFLKHKCYDSMPGLMLGSFYEEFSEKVPIYYYGSSGISLFLRSALCDKINKDYREKGYTKGNGYLSMPHVSEDYVDYRCLDSVFRHLNNVSTKEVPKQKAKQYPKIESE